MTDNLVAKASIEIKAPPARVWEALTDPKLIKQYFFGSNVESDWKVGNPITWQGEWQGKAYEDKGKILQYDEGRLLEYSHFSPLGGQPDVPENYHNVQYTLTPTKEGTKLTITQGNNHTQKEQEHSQNNWEMILVGMKKLLEA